GVRRLRGPPPALRTAGPAGETGAPRPVGGTQWRLWDAAALIEAARFRHVVADPPSRAGNVVVQPGADAARRSFSEKTRAFTGHDRRHGSGRGAPGVPQAGRTLVRCAAHAAGTRGVPT